jgi:hypothetical protein
MMPPGGAGSSQGYPDAVLDVDSPGLTSAEAAERFARYGPNLVLLEAGDRISTDMPGADIRWPN